jgi:hypothetical protein
MDSKRINNSRSKNVPYYQKRIPDIRLLPPIEDLRKVTPKRLQKLRDQKFDISRKKQFLRQLNSIPNNRRSSSEFNLRTFQRPSFFISGTQTCMINRKQHLTLPRLVPTKRKLCVVPVGMFCLKL